jgi:protein-S-isoprenylcysteine O-methyltransferase Ste14
MRPTLERVPPPFYFATCLVLGVALDLLRPLSLGLADTPRQLAVAVPLLLLGALLGLWALRTFRLVGTPNAPFTEPTHLLTSGPFQYSRNPMYVAQLLILAALGAFLNTPWVLAFVPVLALALDRFIIPGEEARLQHAFGAPYLTYTHQVRRWL